MTGEVMGARACLRDVLEPARILLQVATDGSVEDLLDLLRERPGVSDDAVVDLAHGCYLGRRPAHEHLVGGVQVRSDELGLMDADPEVARDLDHGVARDPDERPGRQRRRDDLAVADDEDVLAARLCIETLTGESNGLRPISPYPRYTSGLM